MLEGALGGMTYNKGSGKFTIGGRTGAPNTTDNGTNNLQVGVEAALNSTLTALATKDADDYKNKVEDGAGTDGGLEGDARQISCNEFLKDRLAAAGGRYSTQATNGSTAATTATTAATTAADDALAAAKACDKRPTPGRSPSTKNRRRRRPRSRKPRTILSKA